MQVDYTPFIDRLIQKYEGGYGWNKKDPGGPTNFGITCFDLAEHRGQKMTSMATWAAPVHDMTRAEAEDIYNVKYAIGLCFGALPPGIDITMLDYGVNSGVSRPIHVARALVGLDPGGMDAALLAHLGKVDPKNFVDQMCAERLRFMHAIKGGALWQEFGHGWGIRVADVQAYGDHLAAGGHPLTSAPAAPDLSNVVTPKATNVPKTAGTATAGGAIGTVVAAHQAGFPWLTAALAAAGVAAAGVGYEIWQEHKAAAANTLVHV